MKITVAVARIYGTKDQYGDAPRLRPPDMPLVFKDVPAPGGVVRVDLGAVPADLVEAERMRRAIGTVMLQTFLIGGRDDSSTQERTDKAFDEIDPDTLFGDFNWYTTFVLEREIEIDDNEFDDNETASELDYVFTREVFKIERDAVGYATPSLDVIVTFAASVLETGMFGDVVLDDRVLLFADGVRLVRMVEVQAWTSPFHHLWEHTFVVVFGSPWERLRQSLNQGNLTAARQAAAEIPHVPLSEALELVALAAQQDRERLPTFALAWHSRYVREIRGVRPEEAQAVLALLVMLSGPRRRQAARALAHLVGDRLAVREATEALLKIANSH